MSRHKHYECIVAWAEGRKIEVSSDGNVWRDVDEPAWYETSKYRIKKEPVITFRYFKGQSDKNWNGMYVEINPDLEKWDLKITYQDGKEVKAEVAE